MHIMYMLGVIALLFFVALFLMCFFRDKLRAHPFINYLFIGADLVVFFCWNYAAYELGWLVDGFMTLENISPFICTLIPFTLLLNDRINRFTYPAIAFLGFGMFLAMFISPEHAYLFSYKNEAGFIHVAEAACHLVMALYAFYLVLIDKVQIRLRNLWRSVACMFSVVGFGVLLNLFFHRNNFGMDMYGNYSIYFLDIFGSFAATFVAYLVGIFGTVLLGLFSARFIDWLSTVKVTSNDAPSAERECEAEEEPGEELSEESCEEAVSV